MTNGHNTLYKSLILPHLNYGLLLWGVHLQDISVLQKKAIRVVTNNTNKSHTQPIFKEYGVLNVNDMFLLNKLKFLHKLYHNNLPVYFEGYWEHLTKTELEYNLRSRMLPVPRIRAGQWVTNLGTVGNRYGFEFSNLLIETARAGRIVFTRLTFYLIVNRISTNRVTISL